MTKAKPNKGNPSTKLRAKNNHALLFIFITVLLDVLALGLIIPILPKLILNFMGGDSSHAALMVGLFATVWAFMQFFASPIIGSLSDRFGRRPIILLSNFGTGLDYVVMALAPTIGWLFLGRSISGITTSSISTAFAYIADSTTPQKRAAGFGLMGAAFSLGFVLGPTLGGILGDADPRLPFWVAAGLSFANFAYGYFVLPESLPQSRRVSFSWKKANPVGSLVLLKSRHELFGLAGIYFINMLVHVVLSSVFVLYALYRYHWDSHAVGYCLAWVGICTAVVQGGLVRPAVKRFGEKNALYIGLLLGMAGFAAYGWAPSGLFFLCAVPIFAFWGFATSACQSMMTKLVSHKEQGQLQGANGSLRAIAEMIGPALFTLTFAFCIDTQHSWQLPGAPFYLAGLLMFLNILLALFMFKTQTKSKR